MKSPGTHESTAAEPYRDLITAAEMGFMRRDWKCICKDHNRNEDILAEMETETILYKLSKYKRNWT
jgi:hypothetical protein